MLTHERSIDLSVFEGSVVSLDAVDMAVSLAKDSPKVPQV